MSRSRQTRMTDGRGREWTQAESDAVFAELGDQAIDVWRRVRRSDRRHSLERSLYSVGDVQLTPVQIDALETTIAEETARFEQLDAQLGRKDVSCASVRETRDEVCFVSERICALVADDSAVASRCEESRATCDGAKAHVASSRCK